MPAARIAPGAAAEREVFRRPEGLAEEALRPESLGLGIEILVVVNQARGRAHDDSGGELVAPGLERLLELARGDRDDRIQAQRLLHHVSSSTRATRSRRRRWNFAHGPIPPNDRRRSSNATKGPSDLITSRTARSNRAMRSVPRTPKIACRITSRRPHRVNSRVGPCIPRGAPASPVTGLACNHRDGRG
jgi:hypothetical protein